jgi:hypothetical protein
MFLGSMLPGFDWHELPKMVSLVKHYEHHEAEAGGKLSFVDFLVMHYATDHEQQEDHCALPFQHVCSAAFVAVIPQNAVLFARVSPSTKPSNQYTFSVVRDHIPNVWQPPKAF